MSRRSSQLLKAALSAMHLTALDRMAAPFTGGVGVIFMLHQVTPEPVDDFEPNRVLKVTPEFVEDVIVEVRRLGFEIISIDDVKSRLNSNAPGSHKPFAVFTLDDGYKDNRYHAYPVFKRQNAPFTIYVPTDYADGRGDLWWDVLQSAVRQLDHISLTIGDEHLSLPTATTADKDAAFDLMYWRLRQMPEADARAKVHELADLAGYDPSTLCRELMLSWDELRDLANDPLLTIAAHTRSHFASAGLSAEAARAEMLESKQIIERELGRPCRHFSFPYGCENSAGPRDFKLAEEVGFETAVTTRKGLIHASHADAMTALPRLSLNGDFQDPRYVKVLLSGMPFALLDGVRRIKGSSDKQTATNARPRPTPLRHSA